jgi:hypothetical protein
MLTRSTRVFSLLVAAAVATSLAAPAFADATTPATAPLTAASHDEEEASPDEVPSEGAPAPAARQHVEWYGWQTLLADGISLGTMPLELSSNNPSASYLFYASLSGYTFGAPAVHAAHGRWRLAVADLGLRVGAVAVGSLAGAAIGKPGAPSGCDARIAACLTDDSNGLFIGATIGAIAASLLDASLLARDVHTREAPVPTFVWTPAASVVRGGATAGLTGEF